MPLLLDRLSVYGEMLEVASQVLAARSSITQNELLALLLPRRENEILERELLTYLSDLGITKTEGQSLRMLLAPNLAVKDEFRLHILAALRALQDENEVIFDLYRFLLHDESSSRRILDRDAVWPRYNQQRGAADKQRVIVNSPKMASWLRLMSFVGLIRPERSNAFVLSPSLSLLLAMLRRTVDRDSDGMAAVVARIEMRYCPLLQRPGRLHPGHADALLLLERRGELSLTALGDAEGVLLLGRRVTHVALATASGLKGG